ncbi:Glycolate dehydrogenase, iron-sulfur subunit GlcF [hydrothermal vent metagenome]|uniref:Glycolate dehydrogenase, iron-sulfur subunit GlcF n=1 Tax=hydrothermal vent metagenome TaxID=652676 RepID=A0A3B1ANK9_9ZZZZ
MTPEEIASTSDLCVKCGFCLPHCPTYKVTLNEGDSPRGRIALMQAVVSGALSGSTQLYAHFDRCLGCRACEAACPSAVPYGNLIDGVRDLRNRRRSGFRSLLNKVALNLLAKPVLLRAGARLLHACPRNSLATLMRLFGDGNVKRAISLLPDIVSPVGWKSLYPAIGSNRKHVGLFLGCVSQVSDQAALQAAIQMLNRLGQDVTVPSDQVCCGALHLHGGEPQTANKLAERNLIAFGERPLEAIITVASGCGAHIKGYERLPAPAYDVCAYLDTVPWPNDVMLQPLQSRVAVHDPCGLRNTLETAGAVYRLLGKIPDIELIQLPNNELCCGAGGANLLTQPQIADALLDLKLASLRNCRPDILVTSNTGCSLHLAAGIRQAGLEIEVLHPVQLLARQVYTQGASDGGFAG